MSTDGKLPIQTTPSPTEALRTSVTIYFPLLLAAWLALEVFRRTHAHVFERENHFGLASSIQKRWFAWIAFLFTVSDRDILQRCGLDAWVFLRFVRLGEKVAALSVAWSLILFPLYATSPPPEISILSSPDDDTTTTSRHRVKSFDRLSIANVDSSSWRVWLAIAAAYSISLYVMYLVNKEYAAYMTRRHEFLARKAAQQYSIVVTDLPKRLRRVGPLRTYMEYLFPNSVHSVYVGVECRRLEELLEERLAVKYRLDGAQAELQLAQKDHDNAMESGDHVIDAFVVHRPRHTIHRRFLGLCGAQTDVDAIEYFSEQLARIDRDIQAERLAIRARQSHLEDKPATNYGSFAQSGRTWPSLRAIGVDQAKLERLRHTTFSSGSSSSERTSLRVGQDEDEDDNHQRHVRRQSSSMQIVELAQQIVAGITGTASTLLAEQAVMRNAAFVSFRSLRSAHSAQQLLQTENPIKLRIQAAPHIHDVVWENFGLPHQLKSTWALLAAFLTFLIVCFWTIPTAFVTSLANVDKLRHTSPFWDHAIESHPWIQRVLEQLAPLLFSSMNLLASIIFRLLATREGHLSVAEIDASLFTKLCYFQVFQMFFVSAVTGSILTQMMALVDQPKRVLFFLGSSIASQSMLFISFTIVQICVTLPLVLLRVLPVVKDLLHRALAPSYAQRPTRQPWMGLYPLNYYSDLDPAYALAQQYLIFLLVLVFAPIAPLVGYVGFLFFLVSEVVYRRHYFFVNDSKWAKVNSTGVFWPSLFYFIIGALLIAQCTLIGLLSLKAVGVMPLLACTALPFGTALFYWNVVTVSCYPKAAQYLPLDQCCDLDEERREELMDFLDGVYQQPAMAKVHALPVAQDDEDVQAHGA